MYKKTVIRRGCKLKFTEAVASLDALDNKMFNEKKEKPAPSLVSDSAPLPEEKKDIQEAEVIKDEPDKSAESSSKTEGTTQEPSGDLQTLEGAVEKYFKPYKETAPHVWKVNGLLLQIFNKGLDGSDNSAIINTINEADKNMKNVKIAYRPGSYKGKDGLEVKVFNIINAYPPEEK